MDRLIATWEVITGALDELGKWLPAFFLRLILGWEYWEAGVRKYNGENWFASIKEHFIFPFNSVPVELSWFLATWAELIGAVALVFGLFTRFWAAALIVLTIVAMFAVHWPQDWSTLSELWAGYTVSNNGSIFAEGTGNFKLPLLYLIMLLPLLLTGPGRLSVDHFLRKLID